MTGKARILVVEGETPVAMMMVNVLTQAGCDVRVAPTGRKGMELVQESKFDLIVLDTDLPDADGFEICGELKQGQLSRHTTIVFISGRSSEKDRQHGLELGAADYIEKPFGASDFVRRILSHIAYGTASRLTGTISEKSIA
jgi:DNA-binding response OmpR family regulator